MSSCTAIVVLLVTVLSFVPARRSVADDEAPLTDADYEPAVIEGLIETLRTGDGDARYRAGHALQRRGAEARAAIRELFAIIVHDENMRGPYGHFPLSFHADHWLEQFGREVIPAADEALAADDESLRITALQLLARYGFDSAAALPRVQARFENAGEYEAPHVVNTVAALDETGEVALPFLQQALKHDDESVRSAAVAVLDATPPEPGTLRINRPPWNVAPDWQPPVVRWSERQPQFRAQAIALLLVALKDSEPAVRGTAASVLGTYPEAHEQILPALLRHLDDDGEYWVMLSLDMGMGQTVGEATAVSLAAFTKQPDDLLPVLIDNLPGEDVDFHSRFDDAILALAPHAETGVARLSDLLETRKWTSAVAPLGAIGPPARSALPRLEERLATAEDFQRQRIAAAILSIDPQHKQAGKMIRHWLATAEADALHPLWTDLAHMGPRAAPLVPLLLPHIKREDDLWVNSSVTELLQAIGPEAAPAIPILIDNLGESMSDRSRRTLVEIGPASVSPLIEVLRDDAAEPEKVADALDVLAMLGNDAGEAFDDVVRSTESRYPSVREAAVAALGTIGEAAQAVPPLLRALDDPRPLVRRAAVLILGRLPDPDQATVAALSQRLNDEYLEVQFAVCQTLGDFGPATGSATAALEAYRDAGNVHQQHVAERALRRMRDK